MTQVSYSMAYDGKRRAWVLYRHRIDEVTHDENRDVVVEFMEFAQKCWANAQS